MRPNRGWRANTTYVVTLLPGIADLRGNVRNTGAQTVFSTGAALATRTVSGKVWDWAAARGAGQALVQAIHLPDSVTYVAVADSLGAFRVPFLPSGRFLVRAVMDANRNRGIDPREAWDSATVELADSLSLALFAIARDSVAPALSVVSADDSVTLRLTFERALDPARLPSQSEIVVQASDSSRIPVVGVTLPAGDTTSVVGRPPREAPPIVFIVRVGTPLRAGLEYRVSIARVTGVTGISAPAVRVFRMAVPPPPPSATPPVIR